MDCTEGSSERQESSEIGSIDVLTSPHKDDLEWREEESNQTSLLLLDDLSLTEIISYLDVWSFNSLSVTCSRMNLICKSTRNNWSLPVLLQRIKYLILRTLFDSSVSSAEEINGIMGKFIGDCRLLSLELKVFGKHYSTSIPLLFGPVGVKFYSWLIPAVESCHFFPQDREAVNSLSKLFLPSEQVIAFSYSPGSKRYTISCDDKTETFSDKEGVPVGILDLLKKELGPTEPCLSSYFVYHLLEFFLHGGHTCEYPLTLFTQFKSSDVNHNSGDQVILSNVRQKHSDCITAFKAFIEQLSVKHRHIVGMNEVIELLSVITLKYELTGLEAIEQTRLAAARFIERLVRHNYVDREIVYKLLMRVDFGSIKSYWNSVWKASVNFLGPERNILKIDGTASYTHRRAQCRTFTFWDTFGKEVSPEFIIIDSEGDSSFTRNGDLSQVAEILQRCISQGHTKSEDIFQIGNAFTTVFCLLILDRMQFVPGLWHYHRWGRLMSEVSFEKRGIKSQLDHFPEAIENNLRRSRFQRILDSCKCC